MQLASDTRNDIRAARKLRLPWWGVLLGIIVSTLTAWVFDRFGKLDLALPTLNAIGVLGFIVVLKRNLWRHAWFWTVMAFIAATHVELILMIPWTTKWVPAAAIGVIDSLDLIAVLAIINHLGRRSGSTCHFGERTE